MLLVVMGVSGSGKSTVAAMVAAQQDLAMAEGDDHHTPENKAKMAAGIPLNDDDRGPWLNELHSVLMGWQKHGVSGVLTCSALKETYRERLAAGLADVRFVWLDPPRRVIEERLSHRTGHYMNPNLLDSQLNTLEPPKGTNVLHVTSDGTPETLAAQVMAWIMNPDAKPGIPHIDS